MKAIPEMMAAFESVGGRVLAFDADGFQGIVRRNRIKIAVIASIGGGWDHASVSTKVRPPSWAELEFIKRLLWREDEVAVQFHVPPSKHINIHSHVLHLWRDQGGGHALPPEWMV